MALRTSAGTIEVLLPELRVAGLEISDSDRAAIALIRVGLCFCVVNERDDGLEVRGCPYDSAYAPKPLRTAIAESFAAA